MTLIDQSPALRWRETRSPAVTSRRDGIGSGVGIQELADSLGSTLRALRYYEDAGLITPLRDDRGRREYGPETRRQAALIVMLRRSGQSVPAIKAILSQDDETGEGVRARIATAVQERLDRLRQEIEETQSLLDIFGPANPRRGTER